MSAIILYLCLLLVSTGLHSGMGEDNNDSEIGYFWQVTDLHFDTNYSLSGDPTVMCHDGGQGQDPDKSLPGKYGNPDCDSPMALLESTLQFMKTYRSTPSFILWTGPEEANSEIQLELIPDEFILIHNPVGTHRNRPLQCQLQADWILNMLKGALTDKGWEDGGDITPVECQDNLAHIKESDYDAEKSFSVIKNVTRLIKEAFPDVPLMPSIGNHDSWPAGSIPAPAVAPDTDYYLKLQKIAGWNVQNGILQQDNVGSFNKGGYYTQQVGMYVKIFNLNTILWYKWNPSTTDYGDPGDQFKWLEEELKLARKLKMKVILAGHIAPGFRPSFEDDASFYPAFNLRFLKLLDDYKDIITACIFGHDHTDSFHLTYDKDSIPKIALYMAPSVTPHFNKNPATRLYTYNKSTAQVLDYTQFYLDLRKANEHDGPWHQSYKATDEYSLPDLTALSLHRLLKRFSPPGSADFKKYIDNNFVKSDFTDLSCNASCKQHHLCAIGFLDIEEHHKCLMSKDVVTLLTDSVGAAESHAAVVIVVILVLLVAVLIIGLISYRQWRKPRKQKIKTKEGYNLLMENNFLMEEQEV